MDLARLKELQATAWRRLWQIAPRRRTGWQGALIRVVRIVVCVFRDLVSGQLSLQSMGLVYMTLLSLAPLLAVSFALLKAFNVHYQAEPVLLNVLGPLGERGIELSRQIVAYVENVRIGVPGALGVVLLIGSGFYLIQKAEDAFNYCWHVRRTRVFSKRFTGYLSVLLVGPVLMFSAFSLTTSALSTPVAARLIQVAPVGWLVRASGRLVPYLLVLAAFTLIYMLVPNARVRLGSALTGAIVAALVWQLLGWVFATFVVHLPAFAGIYSGLAIFLLLMLWMYSSWLVLLSGASIAFYHQNPEYMGIDRQSLKVSPRLRARVALTALYLAARRHLDGGPAWTAEAFSRRLQLPLDAILEVLELLEARGLMASSTSRETAGYLPARALESIKLSDVLEAIRTGDEVPMLAADRVPAEGPVDEIEARIDAAIGGVVGDLTLRDLAGNRGVEPPGGGSPG